MTDLPRYHTGQLGAINFQTLNEIMRRLDALQPLVETAGVEKTSAYAKPDSAFLVYASTPNPPRPGRYDWREVLVRGESTPSIPVTEPYDSFAVESDPDWDDIADNASFRSGKVWVDATDPKPVEDDSYAISVDPSFGGGYAMCFAFRRTDGTSVFILNPIGEITPIEPRLPKLLYLGDFIESESFESNGRTVSCHKYQAMKILVDDNAPDPLRLTISGNYQWWDFSATDPNQPISPASSLTPRKWNVGSVVVGLQSLTDTVFIGASYPRFDVEC